MSNTVDQEARDVGNRALAHIEAHESLCGERWSQARGETKGLRADIKALRAQFWYLITATIGGQAALLLLLLSRLFP